MKRGHTKKERAAYMRWWREKSGEKYLAYKREWTSQWRKKNGYRSETMAAKKWKINNRVKYNAQSNANYHILVRNIARTPCVVCGEKRVHAHHPDYRFPLQVIFLCALHHKRLHLGKISLDKLDTVK